MFRPQSVAIRPAAAPEPPAGVAMHGVVRHREFLGSLIRYAVAVGDSVILVDDAHKPNQPSFPLDARVVLSLASEQAVVLAD